MVLFRLGCLLEERLSPLRLVRPCRMDTLHNHGLRLLAARLVTGNRAEVLRIEFAGRERFGLRLFANPLHQVLGQRRRLGLVGLLSRGLLPTLRDAFQIGEPFP